VSSYEVITIGVVESTLTGRGSAPADAPRQGDEGAPDAWIAVDAAFAPALDGIAVGDRPNPIGLHSVEVLAIDGTRLRVAPLEAIAGRPVIDIRPDL
jgi:tRNA (Thr-GGU) A37 N-methylase